MRKTVSILGMITVMLTGWVMSASPASKATIVYQGGPGYFWKVSKDIQDKRRLYSVNTETMDKSLLYETSKDYVVGIAVSPSDTLLAILEGTRGFTPPGEHDYSVLPRNSLLFIDTSGKVIATLDEDVRKFSWSPDGEKIAYITGTYYEGGVGFKTTGVWIYDLKDKRKAQIKKDFPHNTTDGFVGGGFEINWARHDGDIYIQDFDYLDGVYRYNTKTARSEKVDYVGIDFSPDGKYYKEIEGSHVFLTETNQDITQQLEQRFAPSWSRVTLSWVFDKGHCLYVINKNPKSVKVREGNFGWEFPVLHDVLYDVEEDKVVKEVTMPISRWTAGPDKLVFEKDGTITVETYEKAYKQSEL